jgi:uncharacterized membrane protein YeaQ/YmgE (transglycosylase-associated protein family)
LRASSKERLMMGILGWIIFGIIVGALAKLVMPGLLGIVGAVLGGVIGRALGMYGPNQTAGFVMSFVGAVVVLAIYRMIAGRRLS